MQYRHKQDQPPRKRRGALGFLVLRFWLFFRSVFRFFRLKTSVFRFWCSLWFADFPFFSIWFLVFAKNTNGFSDLITVAVFGFSSLTYLGSGFSSLWATITRLHWSWIATKCKGYREECMTNQFTCSRTLPHPGDGTAKHGTLPEFHYQCHFEVGDQVTGHMWLIDSTFQ